MLGDSPTTDPALTPGPRKRAALSVLVLLILGLQIGLAVRTRVLNDDRYGFAMFHEAVTYKLRYSWVLAGGGTRRVDVEDHWLRSRGRKIRGKGRVTSIMGEGTVRLHVQRFVDWLYENKLPEGAVGAEARMKYRKNGRGEWQTATFTAGEVRGE